MSAKRRKSKKLYAKTKKAQGVAARRGLVVSLSIVLTVAILFGLYVLVSYIGSLFFSKNDAFTMKNIVMQSDGRLSSAQLFEYSNLDPDMNLFEVDFDELRANLEAVPLVESLTIQRRLPDTLVVDVIERVAVAQVNWKWRAVPFLVDRTGVVLPATRTGRSLPLIDGLKFDRLRPGEQIRDPGVQYALELLSASDELGLGANVTFERFDLRSPDCVNAYLADGVSARFPRHSASNKLVRLVATLQVARERGQQIKTVDLVPEGLNTPVIEY